MVASRLDVCSPERDMVWRKESLEIWLASGSRKSPRTLPTSGRVMARMTLLGLPRLLQPDCSAENPSWPARLLQSTAQVSRLAS